MELAARTQAQLIQRIRQAQAMRGGVGPSPKGKKAAESNPWIQFSREERAAGRAPVSGERYEAWKAERGRAPPRRARSKKPRFKAQVRKCFQNPMDQSLHLATVLNPATGRHVMITGKVGRAILAAQGQ